MTPTATAIVRWFLEKHGESSLRVEDTSNALVIRDTGEVVSRQWLTAEVWRDFKEAPAQAAIGTAQAVLRALAEKPR